MMQQLLHSLRNQGISACILKTDGPKRSLPIIAHDYSLSETAGELREIEEVTKEWKHTFLQNSVDKLCEFHGDGNKALFGYFFFSLQVFFSALSL